MYMKVSVGIFFGVGICMYLYVSAGICSYLSVCYRHRYFAVSRMYVYVGIVCICMYAYTSDQYLHVLQVLDHWGTETTTESPKHSLLTPHPGGPTQGTPGHVPDHFLTPYQPPPSTRFFDFFLKTGVGLFLATAIESARMLWTGHNFARSPSQLHSTGHDCVCWNGRFIYGWRRRQRRPLSNNFVLGSMLPWL
jgi:hypothetical protein